MKPEIQDEKRKEKMKNKMKKNMRTNILLISKVWLQKKFLSRALGENDALGLSQACVQRLRP